MAGIGWTKRRLATVAVVAAAVLAVSAVAYAVTSPPTGGNAEVHLGKTVTSAMLVPTLTMGFVADKQTAIPGDKVTYTSTVTNVGATLTLSGELTANATGAADATVASFDDVVYLGQCNGNRCADHHSNHGHDVSQWSPFVGQAGHISGYTPKSSPPVASGLTLAITPVDTTGVSYPATGDRIAGTVIEKNKTATWKYTATITLSPDQAKQLSDPLKAGEIRNTFRAEVTPRSSSAAQPATVDTEFGQVLFASGQTDIATITNGTVTVKLPDGTTTTVDKSAVAGLASIAPGATVTASSPFTVPVPAAKGSGETDAQYLARLGGLNGKLLTATGSATGTSQGGPVTSTPASIDASTTEQLPVIGLTKTGPTTAKAGDAVTYQLALTNSGTATAATLNVTDQVPAGTPATVTGAPATLAPAATGSAQADYTVPVDQPTGPLTDIASVAWTDTNTNSYGPVSSAFTTQTTAVPRVKTIALTPTLAGPNRTGATQTLTATVTDQFAAPMPGQSVTFTVTGPNATTGTGSTDANGVATFTYTGHDPGNDIAQAAIGSLQSNTASIGWIGGSAPTGIVPVTVGPVTGNFYTAPAGASTFTATPTDAPVFAQQFPNIAFNPPAGVIPHDIFPADPNTRPFTDVTTDMVGNATGTITAHGNGHTAGSGDLQSFDAVLNSTFTVSQPGAVTFQIISADGYQIGVGGGATRVNGDYVGVPDNITSPFNAYPVVGASNQPGGVSPAHSVTIQFPHAGSYPFELDYFNVGTPLSLVLTTLTFAPNSGPLAVFVGYADGIRGGGSIFPYPWDGSPDTTFIGSGPYDAGAIRFDNSTNADITLDKVTVDVGAARADIWPSNMVVPAGKTLVLTQTYAYNFDSSDTPYTTANCSPDGQIPHLNVTIAGVTSTYDDTGQVLNTGGLDKACFGNESAPWTPINGSGTPVNHPLPPPASIVLSPNTLAATTGQPQTFTATVLGPDGNPVANQPIDFPIGAGTNTTVYHSTTNSSGIATVTYTPTTAGTFIAQATTNYFGLTLLSNDTNITVTDPPQPGGPPGSTHPAAIIADVTPAAGTIITKPTAVCATITPLAVTTITSWTVTVQATRAGSQPVDVAQGVGAPPACLGTIDPTKLPNGDDTVTITATDSGGGQAILPITIVVDGKLKLGRFTQTFQDLNVPVGGIAIQVTRTYDSLDKDNVGDFGYGWRLGLANYRVTTNKALGSGIWNMYAQSCSLFCLTGYSTSSPHTVTVTDPTGHQEMFDAAPTGGSNVFWEGDMAFTPRAGTDSSSKLEVIGDAHFFYSTAGGQLLAGGTSGPVFDPQQYKLTLKSGMVLTLDKTTGLVSETDRAGNQVTVDSTGVHSSLGPSIAIHRGAANRIESINGPDGAAVGYGYDTNGDLSTVTDQNSHATTYGYSNHSLTTITGPGSVPLQSATYYPDGRVHTITDANGHTSTLNDDVSGKTERVDSPDGRGFTLTTFDDRGNATDVNETMDGVSHPSHFEYNAHDLTTLRRDANGNTWKAGYDDADNLTSTIDANGHGSTVGYNNFRQPTSITDATGHSVGFDYNPATGDLLSVTDADGHTRTYTYYASGLLHTAADGVHPETTYTYTPEGRQLTKTDGNGGTTTYGYDAAGRLRQESRLEGTVTYTLDGVGQRTDMDDQTGHTHYTVNPLGQTTAIASPQGSVGYGYTGLQRTSMTTPVGSFTYGYDTGGRLSNVTGPAGAVGLTYKYGGVGTVVRPNGVTTTNTYDAAGRLTDITHAKGASTVASFHYTVDPNGNRTALDQTVNGAAWTETYGLDNLDRLTSVSYSDTGQTTNYSYSPAGNRSSMTIGGAPNSGTTIYSYDAAQQLTAMTGPSGTRTLTYDGNGNQTSDNTSVFGYDSQNMTTHATTQQGSGVYTFNGDGRRVTANGASQLWDDCRCGKLPTLISDGIATETYAGDLLEAQTVGATSTFPLADALGSTRVVTDAAGTVISTSRYDAYGSPRTTTGPQSAFGYTGQQTDTTGLINLRARMYDPTNGRFLAVDTVQPNAPGTSGYQLYGYAVSNPSSFADPTGHIAPLVLNPIRAAACALAISASVALSGTPAGPIITKVVQCVEAAVGNGEELDKIFKNVAKQGEAESKIDRIDFG